VFAFDVVQDNSGGTNRVGGQNFGGLVAGLSEALTVSPAPEECAPSEYSRDSTLNSNSLSKLMPIFNGLALFPTSKSLLFVLIALSVSSKVFFTI